MSRVRLLRLVLLAPAFAMLGCGKCHTVTRYVCQSKAAVTVSAPAPFSIACPAAVSWTAMAASASLSFTAGCATDSKYLLKIYLPKEAGPAAYTPQLPGVYFIATFCPDSHHCLNTSAGSLTVTSGILNLESRGIDNLEADVNVELTTQGGDSIYMGGHILETNCSANAGEACEEVP